jgi:hypothetical protein
MAANKMSLPEADWVAIGGGFRAYTA